MMNDDFWNLTGEQPVSDVEKIREICLKYAEKFKDDSDMTERLKVAYKSVMEKMLEEQIKPELGKLIKAMDEIYSDLRTRFDKGKWEKILDSDILKNSISFYYVRNEIMAYLMYHEYISCEIWHMIDEKLNIMNDYDELKAIFPITFIQRVKRVLDGEMMFEYERITALSDDAKNPDEYIQDLFELADMIEYGESSAKISRQIKKLENSGFYHICFDAEKLNYIVLYGGSEDEAEILCDKLAEDENIYVQACAAGGMWYIGKSDEADAIWQRILEIIPDYFKALIGHARYLFENECYEQAKDYVFAAIEAAGEKNEAMKLLSDINDVIMKNYLEMYEENPDDLYDGIQYAWCLCQCGRWDDAIEFLLDMDEDESISYDLNMLLGRAYYSKEDYKKAIPYLQKWIKQTMLLPCDGSEEYKERMERYPAALAVIGECFYETGDINKAVYFMEQSMHAYDDNDSEKLKSMTRLADFYNECGRYDEAFELSEQVISIDDGYVWAYFAHQKAAFETYNTPAVINDYLDLANFVPNIPEPYVYAAKVYMYNNMYDDMEAVLDRAAENEASDSQFDIMRYIIAASRADTKELLDIEEDFESMCASKPYIRSEKKMIARFYVIIENRYRKSGDFDSALEYIDRAIGLEPDNEYHKWEKADLYFRINEDEKALAIYKEISSELEDNTMFLCEYAFCMQYNDLWDESKALLEKILQREDTGMADAYMARVYNHIYSKSDMRSDYMKAKKHINEQIRKTPDSMFAVRERILLFLAAEDMSGFDTGIQDCYTLLESGYDDPIDVKKYLAEFYIKKGECEKALEVLKTIENLDSTIGINSVYKLEAKAYIRMNKGELAEEALRKAYRKTKSPYYMREIADRCMENGDCRGAVRWYKKYIVYDDEDYLTSVKLAKAYLMNKNIKGAEKIYKEVLKHNGKKTSKAILQISYQIFNFMLDAEKAIECAERAVKYTPKEHLTDIYTALAIFSRYINDEERAQRYADKLRKEIIKSDGTVERHIDATYGRCDRIDTVVAMYIGMGHFDKAEEYVKQMMCDDALCVWCSEPCCTDAYIRLAQIKIMRGDFDGMKNICGELLKRKSNEPIALSYIENIEELKKQYENYR